ncbi:hypothetical protein G6L37_01355 [Agrobacterium rubi]|nr:hypothetical protein [Agrobacterium rubi]NTF24039.1 hypothetical protein [Agrobacterium rubi]
MSTGEIAVMSKAQAASRWGEFQSMLTIEDRVSFEGLRIPANAETQQFLLKFDDVVTDGNGRWRASRLQVEQALGWARKWKDVRLLVHCEMGVSRSTAIALAILAERYGKGLEDDAVAHLLRIRPMASCNPFIVATADSILGRSGKLVAALERADQKRFTGGFFIPG